MHKNQFCQMEVDMYTTIRQA